MVRVHPDPPVFYCKTLMQKKFLFKKSLGQNFLHNKKIIERIVNLADDLQNEIVIEIGCGNGSLSEEILSKKPKKLVIIELDERCIELTKERLFQKNEFDLIEFIQMDAQNIDIKSLNFPQKPIIISNLPYSVGSRIFVTLTNQSDHVKKMILMFQKEVAKRIVAKENTQDYGLLSVISGVYLKSKIEFDVSPANFTPAPKVTSSVIKCEPLIEKIDQKIFQKLLSTGKILFENRRKMLRSYAKNLIENFPEYKTLRAENLSPSEILEISKH